MLAGKSFVAGGAAFAVCVGLSCGGARALEPTQSGVVDPSLPALSLPVFLDDTRMTALQDAWRAYTSAQKDVPSLNSTVLAPTRKPSTQAARAARAEQAEPEQAEPKVASVRQRAEELSRRFGAGLGAEPPGASEPGAGESGDANVSNSPGQPGGNTTASIDTAPAASTASPAQPSAFDAKTESAFIEQRSRLAAPMPPSEDIPPSPLRAPKAAGNAAAAGKTAVTVTTAQALARAKTSVREVSSKPEAASETAPKVDVTGDVLPNQLRSFGWDSQPD